MSKYSYEFKVQVVGFYLSGQAGQVLTAKKFAIPRILLRSWLLAYEKNGQEGLKPYRSHFTGEFKCQVIKYLHTNQLSYRETGKQLNVPFSYVASWDKIYQHKGIEALLHLKKGRPSRMSHKANKPVKADKDKSQQELLEEVEYLRTEVAYLKKLRALIEQEEQLAKGAKQKP